MNQHRKQSRKPKPPPVEQQLRRIQRDMNQLGFDIHVAYGTGRYSPKVTIEIWPTAEKESA